MSRNPFTTLAPADSKYMQAGFTFGGPIKRNKLFFFGDFVRTSDDSGRLTQGHVPEAAFRNGDFSAAPTRIYDPSTGNCRRQRTHAVREQPDSRRAASTRSPASLISKIPMPNIPGAAVGAINFEKNYVRERRTNQGDIKITYQVAQNDLVSVRYSQQNAQTMDPAIFGIYGGLKPFAGTGTNPTQSVGGTYNRVWSSTLVQEVRFGRTHHHNEAIGEDYGLTTSQDLGIRGINLNDFTSGITTIDVGGYSDYLIGFETSLPWDREESTWTVSTTATKMWGNHTMKVGGDLRSNRHLLDQVNHPRARLSIPRQPDGALNTDTAAANGYANSLAAFMLDVPNGIERGVLSINDTISIHRGGTHKAVYTYVQDKWQIRPDVTLDLGLRHELYMPLVGYTPVGGQATYDPDTNTISVAGYGDIPENLGVKTILEELQPAHGDILAPNDTNVYTRGIRRQRAGAAELLGPGVPDPAGSADQPGQQLCTDDRQSDDRHAPPGVAADSGVRYPRRHAAARRSPAISFASNRTEGTLHSFNVAYQRILPGGFTAEIAYVGNRGHDILAAYNMNAGLVIGADNAGRPLFGKYGRTADTSDPQPVRSRVQLDADQGRPPHAKRPAAHQLVHVGARLQLLQWRRWRDDLYAGRLGARLSADDVRLDAQLRQQFRLHASVGTRRQVDERGRHRQGARRLAGDGRRLGRSRARLSTSRPTPLVCARLVTRIHRTSQEHRTSSAASGRARSGSTRPCSPRPATTTWGNVERRGLLTGPAYYNLDASIVKVLRVGTKRAEIRADFFNALNIAHYANPNGTLGNANFGRITGILAQTERTIRFGGRFLF